MRYAIVTETYPPEVNGVALTVQALERGLRERGHEVALVRPRQVAAPAPGPGETLVRGLSLPRYPGLRAGLPATRQLLAAWTASRPDALYVATEGPLGWSALRAARRLGIPVATGFHTRFDEYMRDYGLPWLEPVALRWMRHFHNRGVATLVPTRELRDTLASSGFRHPRLLPRAVDTVLFDPARRDGTWRAGHGAGESAPLVIHVGRIAAEKNLALAVRAFRALQAQCPGARYAWVGDGPLLPALRREHPDFTFMGVQRGEALARLFASADLFLFPSRTETFGNVTLEAMASGVPVIAFDYGAAREHLHDGAHGAAIPFDDDAGFVAAAVRIGSDAALARRMGDAARASVLHLSPAQVAADFDALLADIAHRGHGHVDRAAA